MTEQEEYELLKEEVTVQISREDAWQIVASADKIIKAGESIKDPIEWEIHKRTMLKIIQLLLPLCTTEPDEVKRIIVSTDQRLQTFL